MRSQPRPLWMIARTIKDDWTKPSVHAQPYINAMFELSEITDKYYADSARSVVAYFLANAGTWRGHVARDTKEELNRLLKESRPWES